MSNITLSIDDEVLIKVRKLAVERRTSLTAMVRSILCQLATREDVRTEELVSELRQSFDSSDIQIGARTWSREDLHAR